MKRRLFLVATIAAALPSVALAESPTELDVSRMTDLAADAETVWSAIGDFQDMSWHPAIHATTGEGGNEAGATRQLTLGGAGGPTIDETLDSHDPDAMRYAYRITDVNPEVLPVTGYSAHIEVMSRDGGGSTVAWRGTFHRGDPGANPSDAQNDEAAIAAVTGVYQAGLDALTARFGAPES